MRIIELLEGKYFKNSQFVKTVSDKGDRELDYDLDDDVSFFMQNNDEAYRKHVHPIVDKMIKIKKKGGKPSPMLFAKSVEECYKMYTEEYPLRELASELDDKARTSICKKIHEEICQHIEDGKYE